MNAREITNRFGAGLASAMAALALALILRPGQALAASADVSGAGAGLLSADNNIAAGVTEIEVSSEAEPPPASE